jgi:uncharacterized membrane protein YjjB (DUF3815 family)
MDFRIYDISVIPLIMFLTKVIVDIGVPKKFAPLISLILGVAVGILYFSPENILKGVVMGIFMASSAVGFYSGTKNIYQEYHIRTLKRKENNCNKESSSGE